ncbi:MAG: 2-dehydro-3-deoxyphosphooctonate aldolase [Bacteroidetes bacterium]|nr:2-dehydro-3-deoxyphosphooctonate aldolase [Bacteroidota bacterium]
MKIWALILSATCLLFTSCKTTKQTGGTLDSPPPGAFEFTKISQDKTYGYTENNPVMVGGVVDSEGPTNERKFLDALAGPNGEEITYERTRSCCNFKTKNGFMGGGLLDVYELKWKGQAEPIELYINMYDFQPLKVPFGLTRK